MSAPIPGNWRRVLRLDRPPAGAGFIGPPPRPALLETGDAASERVRWRNLLERHSGRFTDPAGSRELAGVQRMLALLHRYREMEDAIIARQLAAIQE